MLTCEKLTHHTAMADASSQDASRLFKELWPGSPHSAQTEPAACANTTPRREHTAPTVPSTCLSASAGFFRFHKLGSLNQHRAQGILPNGHMMKARRTSDTLPSWQARRLFAQEFLPQKPLETLAGSAKERAVRVAGRISTDEQSSSNPGAAGGRSASASRAWSLAAKRRCLGNWRDSLRFSQPHPYGHGSKSKSYPQ